VIEDRETTETSAGSDLEPKRRSEPGEKRHAAVLVIAGPRVGQMRKIDEEGLVVGREPTCELHVPDPGVSRRHARVREDDEAVRVEDLESSNGTYVNGNEIEGPRKLEHGDKVTMGTSTVLKFAYQDPVEETFQQKMYEASLRDELTGAYNKTFLLEHLRSEMSYARRHETPLSLVLFDLDRFKDLNDAHGHVAGDGVLRELADTVRKSIRTEDTFARYGGEEFGIVLRNVGLDGAERMGERIRREIDDQSFTHDGERLDVTVSVGVAEYREAKPEGVDAFITAADEALYAAKDDGRNAVRTAG